MKYIVYKIVCVVNNKLYIGQTTKTLKERLNKHLASSREERTKNVKFYRAIRKYGEDKFKIFLIEEVGSQEELDERELYWINHYDSVENGYNTKATKGKCGGDTLSDHWNKEEISRKIRESKLGDKNPMRINGGLKGERNGMFGKRGSEIPSARRCVAINKTTGEVKEFGCLLHLKEYFNVTTLGMVSSRCSGRTKSDYKGWYFYYYEDYVKSATTIESVDNEKDIIE